ncbi:hypothetical protein [Streptomyces sp. GC420]|uniref:hypothetical protein n=1 Tax=Streptomyces sp. GC420 TaxID=2697568 RepID=UPI001414FEA5|nr:hypothetical protein [Streptomyces sp. GC420]NBM15593.1 hypothetical protein [Streptomyces sp. GC420]
MTDVTVQPLEFHAEARPVRSGLVIEHLDAPADQDVALWTLCAVPPIAARAEGPAEALAA